MEKAFILVCVLLSKRKVPIEIFLKLNLPANFGSINFEPRYEKTNYLHMRKQRRRSASR